MTGYKILIDTESRSFTVEFSARRHLNLLHIGPNIVMLQ